MWRYLYNIFASMIIFGRGKQFRKMFWPVEKLHCSHCNNDVVFWLERISTWFTLFFIPIFPYEVIYFFSCPVCKYGVKLSYAQAKDLIPLAEINNELVQWKISDELHSHKLENLSISQENTLKRAVSDKKTLKKCPHCNEDILHIAKKCKHCMEWL